MSAVLPIRRKAGPWRARLLALLGVAALLPGCANDSTATRIQEKSAVYNELAPDLQRAVATGRIAPGFTREMVYMALGKPSLVVASADGHQVAWTYVEYRATPDEEVALQNRHSISSNILGGKYKVFAGESGGHASQVTTLASDGALGPGDAGTGWRTVAGAQDMERGEVKIPDPTERQKSAVERIMDSESQDLLLTFQDGRLTNLEYVRR